MHQNYVGAAEKVERTPSVGRTTVGQRAPGTGHSSMFLETDWDATAPTRDDETCCLAEESTDRTDRKYGYRVNYHGFGIAGGAVGKFPDGEYPLMV